MMLALKAPLDLEVQTILSETIYFSLSLSLHFRSYLVCWAGHFMWQQRKLLAALDLYQSFFSLLVLIKGEKNHDSFS